MLIHFLVLLAVKYLYIIDLIVRIARSAALARNSNVYYIEGITDRRICCKTQFRRQKLLCVVENPL